MGRSGAAPLAAVAESKIGGLGGRFPMRRVRWVASASALLALVTACGSWSVAGSQKKTVPNELPRSWSLDEIAKETLPHGGGLVYVLAWTILEPEKGLRIESCLALGVFDKDDGYGRWCLVHLDRFPKEKNPKWQESMAHVMGEKGTIYYPGLWIHHYKRFKKQPTNKDIYASLSWKGVDWDFGQPRGYQFVGCGVCEKSWEEAIGEKPTKFFGG
jgi:hypothetical protein